MGMFCLCGYGEKSCGICGAGDGCLAGNGDDDFFPATKEQIIERLDRDLYKNHRDIMIKTLKEKFNYEYTDIPKPCEDQNSETERRIEYQKQGLCCQTKNVVIGRCDNCNYFEEVYFDGEKWRCRCENPESLMCGVYVERNWYCKKFRERSNIL